jgi:methenyltetrahydrofolate cyclohydrolase
VAEREPAPSGGAVAAITAASAAGLVAMAARFSPEMTGAEDVARRADALRAELGQLADEDARAYAAVLEAYRRERDAQRSGAIRQALEGAADVPLAVAERAREVGQLGVRVLQEGNRNLRGDAGTAVLVAHGAARSAALLVRLNVLLGDLDQRRAEQAAVACDALGSSVAEASEEIRRVSGEGLD